MIEGERRDMKRPLPAYLRLAVLLLLPVSGCAELQTPEHSHPSFAPATQPSAAIKVDASQIPAMYHRLVPVDLPAVVRVATAQNLDIRAARQRVEASRGRYEGSVESAFPVISPSLTVQHLQGVNQNADGTLARTNFTDIFPGVLINWIINPGQVIYDIIASKRRLEAAGQQEQAVVQETIRAGTVQYYDLILAQAQVAVSRQAVEEADELLRIDRLRLKTGTGLPADELRAEAALAAAQQDLISTLNGFYDTSIALTLTLHLDPTVMLVPQAGAMSQATLVREDLSIDEMLAAAVRYRPDLQAVRKLLAAAQADKGATVWGALGPQFQAAYSFGSLAAHVTGKGGQDTHSHEQQKGLASAGFALGPSAFGNIKAAKANVNLATLEADSQLDQIRAAVVSSHQASITAAKLIPIARQQVAAAEEALRLAQYNLRAGTMLTLDVLQAQAAAEQARLRYASAMVRYNQSEVNLLAALGLVERENVAIVPAVAAGSAAPKPPPESTAR
jgi:outer membrane protein TolC